MQDKLQKMPYTQHLFAISISNLRTRFCHKNYLCIFLSQKEFAHTFLSQKRFTSFFCRENKLRTLSGKFLQLKVAIRKVQTFWASEVHIVVEVTMNMA